MPFSSRDIRNLLVELVNIESVYPHEKPVLLFIEERLRSFGIESQRIYLNENRWNLLASVGSGSPVVCLNAHADTMPPNGESTSEARILDGKLYGLGSCDDKASIAAMISVLARLSLDNDLSGRVDLLVSVDEEADGQGVRTAARKGYRCDYAIVGEPTSLDILTLHGGLLMMEIETQGVAAHGSAPWNGVNAIDEMTALVDTIRAEVTLTEENPVLGRPSLNLGAISAGDAANRVPDRCRALLDIRIVPPRRTSDVLKQVHNIFSRKRWRNAKLNVYKEGEPFSAIENSKTVCVLDEVSRSVLGRSPGRIGRRYWTEADPFRNMMEADVVVCGAGDARQAHTSNEYVALEEVTRAAEIYYQAVKQLLQPAR